jgi:hypothetical protein
MEPRALSARIFDVFWDEPAQVIRVVFAPGSVCTAAEAEAATDAQVALGRGSAPVLVDMRGMRKIERGAREHFRQDKGGTRALALLVDSPLTKMLANISMRIDDDQTPTRMCTDEATAVAWLHDVCSA